MRNTEAFPPGGAKITSFVKEGLRSPPSRRDGCGREASRGEQDRLTVRRPRALRLKNETTVAMVLDSQGCLRYRGIVDQCTVVP
jgi:hypothetical protein